jgi:hypothetical protein
VGADKGDPRPAGPMYGDSGGYSRFFTYPTRDTGTCVRCGLAISAGRLSSPPSPSADSAPSGAATSPDGTPDSTAPEDSSATPARSTKRRRNATEPAASPTIASQPPTDASSAVESGQSIATTTTTPSRSMCASCAASATPTSTPQPPRPTDDELLPDGLPEPYPRYLIIPKADRAERERGLAGTSTEIHLDGAFAVICAKCNRQKVNVPGAACKCEEPEWVRRSQKPRANLHPTVKPIDLMRHLVRLVTPPGGTILDPFLGSGTTCLAASEEGFRSIGIERELEYLEIAKGRLMATPMGLGLDHGITAKAPPKTHPDLSKHQPKRRAAGENYSGRWAGTDEEPAA